MYICQSGFADVAWNTNQNTTFDYMFMFIVSKLPDIIFYGDYHFTFILSQFWLDDVSICV